MEDKTLKKQEIKKHVATIHCSNTLTLLQRKISNALLYNAYHKLLDLEEHEITIRKLCSLIGYSGHNQAAIKNALRELISTVIEWNIIDSITQREDWTASSILASVELSGPICRYAYSPKMKQLLYSPTMYGKINLIIQSRFRSSYGLALYENCARYKGLSGTKWFDLEEFRKLMGIGEGAYSKFRDVKRRVLDKAVDEVNTYSDIIIEPEVKRVGRKVVAVKFHIENREKKVRLGTGIYKNMDSCSNEQRITHLLLTDFGLTEQKIRELFHEYSLEYIQDKITLIQSSNSYLSGKIRNVAIYLLGALKKDYNQPINSSQLLSIKREKKEIEKERERIDKLKLENKKKEFEEFCDLKISNVLGEFQEQDYTSFLAGFEKFLSKAEHKLALGAYLKHKLGSKIVKAHLRIYARTAKSDFVILPTFEEYINNSG